MTQKLYGTPSDLEFSPASRGILFQCFYSEKVEVESLDRDKFDITGQIHSFSDIGGAILACGTCLKLRESEELGICSISTMQDLYTLIHDSDKVLCF